MTKKRKTKKNSKKRQQEMKIQRKVIFQCVILSVLVLALTYFILNSNVLKSKVDEVTASYISFNNSKTTDMLKISNLSKQNEELKIQLNKKTNMLLILSILSIVLTLAGFFI